MEMSCAGQRGVNDARATPAPRAAHLLDVVAVGHLVLEVQHALVLQREVPVLAHRAQGENTPEKPQGSVSAARLGGLAARARTLAPPAGGAAPRCARSTPGGTSSPRRRTRTGTRPAGAQRLKKRPTISPRAPQPHRQLRQVTVEHVANLDARGDDERRGRACSRSARVSARDSGRVARGSPAAAARTRHHRLQRSGRNGLNHEAVHEPVVYLLEAVRLALRRRRHEPPREPCALPFAAVARTTVT